MTKEEIFFKRSLYFSQWIRKKLPDSNTGFIVTDIDFVLFNYKTKKVMLLEVKSHNDKVTYPQRQIYNCLDRWIKKGIDKDWQYLGWHVVTFERGGFEYGRTYFDGKLVTESEVIKKLSF